MEILQFLFRLAYACICDPFVISQRTFQYVVFLEELSIFKRDFLFVSDLILLDCGELQEFLLELILLKV